MLIKKLINSKDLIMLDVAQLKKEGCEILKRLNKSYPPKPFIGIIANPRVVILGQDPYAKDAINGYAFINPKTTKGSYRNIIKCLQYTFDSELEPNPSNWIDQHVMLINLYFTLGQDSEWLPFTKKIIDNLRGVVIFAWGKKPLSVCNDVHSSCLLLTSSHPSPIYQNTIGDVFVYNCNFKDCNEWLIENTKSYFRTLTPPIIEWLQDKVDYDCNLTFHISGKKWLIKGYEFLSGERSGIYEGPYILTKVIFKCIKVFEHIKRNHWGNFTCNISSYSLKKSHKGRLLNYDINIIEPLMTKKELDDLIQK